MLAGPDLLVILVIALIVFGPNKLPELAKTIGKALGEFRKTTEEMKESIGIKELGEMRSNLTGMDLFTGLAEKVSASMTNKEDSIQGKTSCLEEASIPNGWLDNHERRLRKMSWGKKSTKEEGKLSGPRAIPGPVLNYLVAERKMDPDLVKFLKAVERKSTTEAGFNIRIFDDSEAIARNVRVMDYTSLDERPDLIIYEGSFDERAKQVRLEEKKKINWDTPIFTQAEIQQKIEAISEPGSTVFFYTGRGGKHGGPLGMGAAVIELNPNYPGEKQKKYIVYTADVIDMQPVGKGNKLFDSDKPTDIAHWLKEWHHKRKY